MVKPMFVSLAFLLATLSTCCFCFPGSCPDQERTALSHFKRALLDPYDLLGSWRGLYCCSWKGITCNLHTGHVVRMDFTSFELSVRNSSSHVFHGLLQLQHLEYLDLSRNDFHPLRIPSQLAMLPRLTHLSLSGCGFTGRIPSFIGNMSTLKYLDVSFNDGLDVSFNDGLDVSFSEWIGNLRGLEYLALSGVNLTTGSDRVVQNIAASHTNLTTLDMSGCGVSGTILSSLVNLTSLSHLYLSVNDFTHQPFPNWISNHTSLVSLSLGSCGLRGPIPSTLLSLPHLRNLYLDGNPDLKANLSYIVQHSHKLESLSLWQTNTGGGIPNSIGNMSSLTELDLSYNNIGGNIPWTSLAQLPKLYWLSLTSNQLNGSLPSSFGNLSSLVDLDLSNNSLSGIIPPSLHNLSSLRVLYLDDNKFHGTFLISRLQNLRKISSLDLSNNLLTVIVDGYWIPKFQLNYLSLISCNMQGDFPAFISTQYVIRDLDLSNNNLGGDIPNWLWELIFLKTLNLASNQFWGNPLSSKFTEFDAHSVDLHGNKLQGNIALPNPNVEFLDLSENLFHGFIPVEIGKYAQHLNFFSLAKNNLSGSIPNHICARHMLEVLDLSNNKLASNIQTSFGNCSSTLKVLNLENNLVASGISSMVCLQTLKLGGNRLEGQIPSSLQNCSSLEILDLGYNNMQGEIPNWIHKLTNLRILVLRSNKFEGGIIVELSKLQNLQVLILSNNTFSGNIPTNFGNLKAMINNTQST